MCCVFNNNYTQILNKIQQLISHAVFNGYYVGSTVSTVSVNFYISSATAVKQLSQSARTIIKLSSLDVHKTNTEFYGHATKFLVAYMTEEYQPRLESQLPFPLSPYKTQKKARMDQSISLLD
jgi:hypothetical protein